LLLRAVNEAQVHHIWVKPLSAKEIMDALQQQTEIAGGRTLPLLLATAFESKTETGHGHSYRVAQYALALGHELGLTEDNLRALQLGCLFHDIGKLLLPDQLLKNQTSQVPPVEQTLIRQHPVLGEQLVKGMDLPSEAISVIRHHHERWDGQG